MRKKELVKRAAQASRKSKEPLSQRVILHATNLFLAETMKALTSGQKLELRGFGTLRPGYWPARTITTPQGKTIDAAPAWRVLFKPSRKWKNRAKWSQSS